MIPLNQLWSVLTLRNIRLGNLQCINCGRKPTAIGGLFKCEWIRPRREELCTDRSGRGKAVHVWFQWMWENFAKSLSGSVWHFPLSPVAVPNTKTCSTQTWSYCCDLLLLSYGLGPYWLCHRSPSPPDNNNITHIDCNFKNIWACPNYLRSWWIIALCCDDRVYACHWVLLKRKLVALLSCFTALLHYRQENSGFGDKAWVWVDILAGGSQVCVRSWVLGWVSTDVSSDKNSSRT